MNITKILALAGALFTTTLWAADPALFAIRAVGEKGAAGVEEATFLYNGQTETIYLRPEFLLDGAALVSAQVEPDDGKTPAPLAQYAGKASVRLMLTEEGQKRFSALTKAHLKRQIVLLLDGVVRAVSTVNQELSLRGFSIGGFASIEEAEAVAKKINDSSGSARESKATGSPSASQP